MLVVVADMIGTGIFMTTGNVLGLTGSALVVLVLWVIGGCIAIAGALCYAELATTWPDVGGEYIYLKKSWGLLPAFLTGWISLIVGFSAPVATGALLVVQYAGTFFRNLAGPADVLLTDSIWVQKTLAAFIILFFGAMHMVGVKRGTALQNGLTIVKILIVVCLIGLGLNAADFSSLHRLTAAYPVPPEGPSGFSAVGLALLIVMFAYSGWNGASYIAGEIKQPEKNLPRAMLGGTVLTVIIYLLLNIVFLLAAPGESIIGKDEIGAIAARSLFSPALNNLFTLSIAVILLSAVSVQTMVGPRVSYAMAKDHMIFSCLARLHPRHETPWLAILIQTALAIVYVYLGSAMTLVIYMGFALNIFPVLAVIGLMSMRRRKPDLRRPYRVPGYPLVPLFYIVASIFMMIAALMSWTSTSLFALGVLAAGVPAFWLWRRTTVHSG